MFDDMIPIAVAGVVVVALIVVWNLSMQKSRSPVQNREKPGVKQRTERLTPTEYQAQYVEPDRPHLLVDVRTPEEFSEGHIPGAVNIELDALDQRMSEIPPEQPVVLYCRSGRRSEQAAQILARSGYEDVANLGGIIEWRQQGLPIE